MDDVGARRRKTYAVALFGCGGPNAGVKLIGNQRFPTLVDDALGTFRKLKMLTPDIYITGHPQMLFAGKIDRMKAGERPQPLLDPGGWARMLDDAEANFMKRVQAERAQGRVETARRSSTKREIVMAGINTGKVVEGSLLAGLVANAFDSSRTHIWLPTGRLSRRRHNM